MKDRFERAKQFVARHRTEIAFGSGICVGIGITLKVGARLSPEMWLSVSAEELQKLIEDPGGVLVWEDTSIPVYLVSELHSKYTA